VIDEQTGSRWDITGRAVEGQLTNWTLTWIDSVQVKWFAWSAEYPATSIYERAIRPDYQPLAGKEPATARPHGNLDESARHFAILKRVDARLQRVTLLLDGETEQKEWAVLPDAEFWHAGWWGRLDQFKVGDRLWVWIAKDRAKQPYAISLIADEMSEQALYAPVHVKSVNISVSSSGSVVLETKRKGMPVLRTVKLANAEFYRGPAKVPRESLKVGEAVHVQTTGDEARLILDSEAFETGRLAQQALLRRRWSDEGLPGTLVFVHAERRELEVMLDHQGMQWGRSLQAGDMVTVQAVNSVPAIVRKLRPWRERTQILLAVEESELPASTVGQRVSLRMTAPPLSAEDNWPTPLDKSTVKAERVEWLMASIYCTCGMHDRCAGHTYTLAACDAGPGHTCGLARATRQRLAEKIDQGQTDRQIFEELRKERGPNLVRPHMSP
jgi:hypothetical protein